MSSARNAMTTESQKTLDTYNLQQTFAVVTKSDSMNNVCSIQFVDGGHIRNRDNVPVKIYGSGMDWFPEKGETVEILYSSTICEITGRFANFIRDLKPDTLVEQDRLSDGIGGAPGGVCDGGL